ncbi:MAG: acetolactate synthase large subunit, partial [Ruminococcus sp.]|nr:acetolactate synthase large subunit [Ruminococcus sp.]
GMHGHYASSVAEDEADLLIALGVRFSDRATGNKSRYAKNFKIIHIDIDSAELSKNISADLPIQGDIKDAIFRLTAMVQKAERPQWHARTDSLRQEEKKRIASAGKIADKALGTDRLAPYDIIDIISSRADDDAMIVTDVGQHQMWTAQRYPLKKNRSFITSGGLGTMGYGLGAAVGAALASGSRTILFTGDGSFGMNLNELATAVTQELPIVIVIMNNGVLGMVRQLQTLFFDKHYSSTTFNRKTDFVKLAEAFGAKGSRASNTKELKIAAAEAFAYNGPFVIDCIVNSDEFVLPMLPPEGSIDDIITEIK